LVGRLVLIKYVFQDILIYLFSSLDSLQSVLKTIHNIQRNFVWKGHKSRKKWALVTWEKICKPKLNGVLSLKDPCSLNEVMGGEYLVAMAKAPKRAMGKVMEDKICPPHQ
jgi:hypothetical protein